MIGFGTGTSISTELATLSDCEYDSATDTYYVNVGEVSILDYSTTYTYGLYVEEWDADFEEYTGTMTRAHAVKYSINSYINSMWGGAEPTAMNNLARALYNYSVSAAAYQNAH